MTMPAAAPLLPDVEEIRRFVGALFRYADPASYVSLRAFDQRDRGTPPVLIEGVLLGDDIEDLVIRAANAAGRAGAATRPAVFAPPVCTFLGARTAKVADIANGVALSVDIDHGDPAPMRARLEALLGPCTVVVASGGVWANPETGELHDKVHLHWRLAEATAAEPEHARLREARWLAAALVGADPSGAPLPHPLRWPGSWNTKSAPRMARIVALNDAAEIHLDEAAERLAEAVEAAGFGKRQAAAARPGVPQAPVPDIAAALATIPNAELHWDDWNRMGMAVWRASGGSPEGLAAWEEWSAKSPKHSGAACADRWAHYATSPPQKLGAGTIFFLARAHGWTGRARLRVVNGGRGEDRSPDPPVPRGEGDSGGQGAVSAPAVELPDCPVTALGMRDGICWFFDAKGQLRGLNATQMANRGNLDLLLCAEVAWAAAAYPAFDKEGTPTGDYQVKAVSRHLIRACADAGLFRDDEPRRGPGVWRDEAGVPVLHLGDTVITLKPDRERRRAGFRAGGALWPAHPSIRPPARPALAEDVRKLEALFRRWNWGGLPHERIFLGLWAAGLLGAAIRWRPHGLVVGEAGSGKTTLMEFYETISPLAVFSNDATEAGLRQDLSGRAAPLLIDEAEGDSDGAPRIQRVIELLRRASGGGGARSLRGSAGGHSQKFVVMSPALLGAILPPVLLPQDSSRITRMDILKRDPAATQGLPDAEEVAWARKAAPAFWGRALAGLPRFGENFAVLRQALLARGCAMRLVDQVGTILAARAMMLRDDPLAPAEADEEVAAVAWLAPSEADQAGDGGPASCLQHLLQSALEVTWNGARPTVGFCVARALLPDCDREREALEEHGLRVSAYPSGALGKASLYVAERHPRLARLYEGTQWAGGRWREDLRRLPGAITPEHPQRIGKAKPRCTVLPPALLPDNDAPAPATIAELRALQEEFHLGDGWVLAMIEARWTERQARDDAFRTGRPP